MVVTFTITLLPSTSRILMAITSANPGDWHLAVFKVELPRQRWLDANASRAGHAADLGRHDHRAVASGLVGGEHAEGIDLAGASTLNLTSLVASASPNNWPRSLYRRGFCTRSSRPA